MTEAIENRTNKAIKRMVTITQGANTIEDIADNVIAYQDPDGILVFCMYDWSDGIKNDWTPYTRTGIEEIMIKYLASHQSYEGTVRLDVANLMIVGNDRAMVRYIKDYKWEV